MTTPAGMSTHVKGCNEDGKPDQPFGGSELQQNGPRLEGMLVHDMGFQEMARQRIMEGSGKMRAYRESQVMRLTADSQRPATPLLQCDFISAKNWIWGQRVG